MYFDCHTHHPVPEAVKGIRSLYQDFDRLHTPGFYSIGLHPWYIPDDPFAIIQKIDALAVSSQVVAIGETGLDKLCNTDWVLQVQVFREQIRLAKRRNKPLIIHCVRAFQEIQSVLREEEVSVPVIFHGFNKSLAIARELISQGYYLSFGKSLEKQSMQAVFTAVPAKQVFLETDDADIEIGDVYRMAAAVLQIDPGQLEEQLNQNALHVFGI